MLDRIEHSHSHVFSYLKECYRSDNREMEILDVFSKKVEFCLFIEKKDVLFNDLLPRVSVKDEKLPEIGRTAAMMKREKRLNVGFMFCTGRVQLEDKVEKICSPLWIVPAEIESEGIVPSISVHMEGAVINYPLLRKLANIREFLTIGDKSSEIISDNKHSEEELVRKLPLLPLNDSKLKELIRHISAAFPFIDFSPVSEYPEQFSSKKVKNIFRRKLKDDVLLQLVPGSAVLLTDRSIEARGVITEMQFLETVPAVSPPLEALINKGIKINVNGDPPGNNPAHPKVSTSIVKVSKKKKGRRSTPNQFTDEPSIHESVPAILSAPQKRILANAVKEKLSLVIGPPGTGKSFTIAAAALDHLGRGQNVLIASRTNQAVDVVADKIESILGIKNFVIRGGRKNYLKELKQFLQNLLMGILPFPKLSFAALEEKKREHALLGKRIHQMERIISHRSGMELEWGALKNSKAEDFIYRLEKNIKIFFLQKRIKKQQPYWELIHDYQDAVDRYLVLSRDLLKERIRANIQEVLNDHYKQLKQLLKAISSRKSYRQEELFSQVDFREIFKALPVWLVNLSDINRVLPMESELFDITLIDEATQCDVASSIPVLYRARRAVVIGDPHQLRHISFLSYKRQEDIARRIGLNDDLFERFNYRDYSTLDVVRDTIQTGDQVVFLDEHFRSMPQLIRFSNRKFYGNSLKIMQERPTVKEESCLFFLQVKGQRNDAGVNEIEANILLDKIKHIVADQEDRFVDQCDSIGVLSPFSAQAAYISKRLAVELSTDNIERHNILVGTPYAFQGEERDVMLLSLCLDDNSHPAAFHYLNRDDVFNVSITRARNRQIVYGSFDTGDEKLKGILKEYLVFIASEGVGEPKGEPPRRDFFMEEVLAEVSRTWWYCWPNFPVAGFHVDLMVERDKKIIGIDLIGYPGYYSASFELEKYRLFNRAGLPIFPLTYHAWLYNRQACLDALEKWFKRLC